MAYGQTSIDQYRKNAVNGASPLRLVVMLYDGCLKFIEATKHAMSQGDLFKQNEQCQKAQNIVAELMSSLDMKRGGDIAQNLFALYSYVYDRLVQANLEDNPMYLDQALKVMSDLRESWVELERQQAAGQLSPAGEPVGTDAA